MTLTDRSERLRTFPQLKPCQRNSFLFFFIPQILLMSELRGVIVNCTGWLPQSCSPFTHFSYTATRNIDLTLNSCQIIEVCACRLLKSTNLICTFCSFISMSSHHLYNLMTKQTQSGTKTWRVGKLKVCLNSCPVGLDPVQSSADERVHYDRWSAPSSVQMGAAAAWRGCTLKASFTALYNYCEAQYGGHWLTEPDCDSFYFPFSLWQWAVLCEIRLT